MENETGEYQEKHTSFSGEIVTAPLFMKYCIWYYRLGGVRKTGSDLSDNMCVT